MLKARGIKCSESYPAGQVWAAVNDQRQVVAVISKKAPRAISGAAYEEFKTNAKKTLSALGKVQSGDIAYFDGECYFMPFSPRSNANRSRLFQVDLQADWTTFQAQPVSGWNLIGTVAFAGQTGALGAQVGKQGYALIAQGTITPLDYVLTHQAVWEQTQKAQAGGAGEVSLPCASPFPAGPVWVAVHDNIVVAAIERPEAGTPDYQAKRDKAKRTLLRKGRVLAGKIVQENGDCRFVK